MDFAAAASPVVGMLKVMSVPGLTRKNGRLLVPGLAVLPETYPSVSRERSFFQPPVATLVRRPTEEVERSWKNFWDAFISSPLETRSTSLRVIDLSAWAGSVRRLSRLKGFVSATVWDFAFMAQRALVSAVGS